MKFIIIYFWSMYKLFFRGVGFYFILFCWNYFRTDFILFFNFFLFFYSFALLLFHSILCKSRKLKCTPLFGVQLRRATIYVVHLKRWTSYVSKEPARTMRMHRKLTYGAAAEGFLVNCPGIRIMACMKFETEVNFLCEMF